MIIKLYLDVCCLNRPFDDQSQDRIRLEAESVLLILLRIESGEWSWVLSEVMLEEIDRTPDADRRRRVGLMMDSAGRMMEVNDTDIARGQELESRGFHSIDALHIACAESGGAEVFLTTDDRLLRVARRTADELLIRVANPLDWLREMTGP